MIFIWNDDSASTGHVMETVTNDSAGLAARQVPRTPVQVPYQQASQRTSVRPISSGAATATAHFNVPRGTTFATTPSLTPGMSLYTYVSASIS